MQVLKEKLGEVTKLLTGLAHTDSNALVDAKNLKSLVYVVDRVLDIMDTERCKLEQLRLKTLNQIDQKITSIKPTLEKAEQKFMVERSVQPAVPRSPTTRLIPIDFAGIDYMCAFYRDRTDIPVLNYGAVMIRSCPVILFRYGPKDFVSVTPSLVTDYSQDNAHTVCCSNGSTCEYGEQCRYYHDPAEWPESEHQQRFSRTSMVKKSPYFGHSPLLTDQIGQVTFDNLRTLARYCAVMSLMIHMVAKK